MPTVVLVDDHQMFRQGLRKVLAESTGYTVVGEADDGASGIEIVQQVQPDICIIDVSMPGMSGLEVCRQLKGSHPDLAVVMLTMHHSEDMLRNAFSAGADAFVLKQSAVEELLLAMQAVSQGQKYISSKLTSTLLDGFLDAPESANSHDLLTDREREIVRLIAQGIDTNAIGELLHISSATVKTHRNAIMKKLDVHKNIDLVKYALKSGLIELD